MFGLFKKKSKKEKLNEQYQKLMKESFEISKTNRKLADDKYAEAEAIMKEIEQIKE
ncbi:MAG: Lacal_2735 family protein [Chitinophagales bacterium]